TAVSTIFIIHHQTGIPDFHIIVRARIHEIRPASLCDRGSTSPLYYTTLIIRPILIFPFNPDSTVGTGTDPDRITIFHTIGTSVSIGQQPWNLHPKTIIQISYIRTGTV